MTNGTAAAGVLAMVSLRRLSSMAGCTRYCTYGYAWHLAHQFLNVHVPNKQKCLLHCHIFKFRDGCDFTCCGSGFTVVDRWYHFVPSLAVWYVGEGLTVFVSHCSSVNSIINRLMLCHAFSFCHRYGFGSEGKPEYKIGPDKDIIYEVTLKDFQRVSPALCFFINSQSGYESGFGLFLKQKKQCLLNFCDINCVSTRLKNPGKWT